MKDAPPDLDRLIQESLSNLGYCIDAPTLAENVRRLDQGLPREDEFSVICSWLGECRLLHKLDQQQIPVVSKKEFQVPDLFALFSAQRTKSPVLIEIKSNRSQTLSFKPDYLTRLQNYAELLNLPLLIAWKFRGVWTLFEARHLKKAHINSNISLQDALKENLLGILVGDLAFTLGPGVGIHLSLKKDNLIERQRTATGHQEEWLATIDDVKITDNNGNPREDLSPAITSLLMSYDLNVEETHTDTHIHVSYLAQPGNMQFAHAALVNLLNWELPIGKNPHWRSLLRKEQITSSIVSFRETLQEALDHNIAYLVIDQPPNTLPDFFIRP